MTESQDPILATLHEIRDELRKLREEVRVAIPRVPFDRPRWVPKPDEPSIGEPTWQAFVDGCQRFGAGGLTVEQATENFRRNTEALRETP